MNEKLNKLNCMNYSVDNGEEQYYLCCGLRALWRFSKKHNISFKNLCNDLYEKGYYALSDEVTQIEMI